MDDTLNPSALNTSDDSDDLLTTGEETTEDLDDERRSIREEYDDDVPEGLEHSDPGIVPDDWEAREIRRGAGDNEDEEDIEELGYQVDDGGSSHDIDTFGDKES